MSLSGPRIARDRLVTELSDPSLRLVRLIAPAGYGKTTVARAILERAGSHAVCDLALMPDAVSVARGIVEAAATALPAQQQQPLSEQFLALGGDEAAWWRFAERFLADIDVPLMLAFENGESIVSAEPILAGIGRVIASAAPNVRAVTCARVSSGVRFGRFAGPDAVRVVGADELRFDSGEIAQIFAGISVGSAMLRRIETFTRGWPIVVMMLYLLAKRGRLEAYLSEESDVADLYGYLADEVYRFLSAQERRVLEAIAAIPDALESDLAILFGNDYAAALEALEAETPFVSRKPSGGIEVHPVMRAMLARQVNFDAVLERLSAAVDRADGGLRAARIALHRKRPDDAALALANVRGDYLLETPTPELNALLSELPDEMLVRHPELWSYSQFARAFARDPIAWIDEGERVLAALRPETAPAVQLGTAGGLANAMLNRGRFVECEAMLRRFAAQARGDLAPQAELLRDFWLTARDGYAGQEVDVRLYGDGGRFAPFMQPPATRALIEYDVIARQQRLLGDRVAERATLERAVDVARSTKIPLVGTIVLMDASFGAWFAGEDALHARYLGELEAVVNPTVELGSRHYLACARGTGNVMSFGTEKIKSRAYGFIIAAALAPDPEQRRQCAQEAVVAADHSAQPFAQIIARVALAHLDPATHDAALQEASALAASTCSRPLENAVEAVRSADPRTTMLSALTRRFTAHLAVLPERKKHVTIRLGAGDVLVDGQPVAVTNREMELLTLLAVAGRALPANAIAPRMWPGADVLRATDSLKTYASRLRSKLGDPRAVVSDSNGYRLTIAHSLEVHDPQDELSLAQRVRRWEWLPAFLVTTPAAVEAAPALEVAPVLEVAPAVS